MKIRYFLIVLLILLITHGPVHAAFFRWERATPESQGLSSAKLEKLKNLLAGRKTKKLLLVKNDKIIYEWYADGWKDTDKEHYSASLAKALVGGMSLLVAMQDGLIYPDMPACFLIPKWKQHPQKSQITIRHLATHTSGIEDAEVRDEIQRQMRLEGLDPHMDLPGWKGQFWRKDPDPFLAARDNAKVVFTPGDHFAYSNPGIAMLTYAVTASLSGTEYKNIRQLLKKRILNPLGISPAEFSIGYNKTYKLNNLQLVPSWGGGAFTANAVARIGRLLLKRGWWEGEQLIDPIWVDRLIRYDGTAVPGNDPKVVQEKSSLRYKKNSHPASTLGGYTNFDGIWTHVPRDAFGGAGAGNQHLFVIPSMNLIIVRNGKNLFDPKKGEGFWLGAERYLLNPIMDAHISSPYPHSDFITGCTFAPKKEVIRIAKGSDNWPMTWADDNYMYTAYGDGWGFEPRTDIKLSLGFSRISGSPPDIKGENIRTQSGERVGQGHRGEKASGVLSIGGTLYCLVRNAGNSRLMWSTNKGRTWISADWKFEESFGSPTFLNYGKDYSGARDEYVYIYSQDEHTAYRPADHYVMARVTKNHIKEWEHYEYFAGLMKNKQPKWTGDIRKRKPIFSNPAKCYRSGISYNSALKRYLWTQIIPLSHGDGPRFSGGLGIFEGQEPWGPWKTVYYSRQWDIGPGESARIPTKWISKDGTTCHIVFSGDDFFSVREIKFKLTFKSPRKK